MNAINKVSTFSIQNTISYCVGNKVQTKNPEFRGTSISGNETSRDGEILSGLGIYGDRYRRRPYTFAYGNSTEICGQYGCGDIKEEYEQGAESEVSFPQAGILG
jgi:hypothetical protein